MSKGGRFRRRGRKNPEDLYIAWRRSEGFSEKEARILYENLDGNEIARSQSNVFSKAVKTLETDILVGIHALDSALLNLGKRMQLNGLFYAEHWNRVHTSLTLASTGNYQVGLIILRNCIEGFLRSNFLLLNAICDKGDFSELMSIDGWEDAISDKQNVALSIGPMCKILDASKLVKPIKNVYYHMKIDNLNLITHANLSTRTSAEDNFLVRGNLKREFSEQYLNDYLTIFNRFVEAQIIFFQNVLDRIKFELNPIVETEALILDSMVAYGSDTFPKLAKLKNSRLKKNRIGCELCWDLTDDEIGSRDLTPNDWKKLRRMAKRMSKEEYRKAEEKIIKKNRKIADQKMSSIMRGRIEPGRVLQKCPRGCEENWRLLKFRPGLAPIKFSCSKGERQIFATEETDCPECEGRGVIIADCECGQGCPCGEVGKHLIFCAASSSGGMFDAISAMEEDFKKQKPNHMIMPGLICEPEFVKVGIGKNLIKSECGCPEDWCVVWTLGDLKITRNKMGGSTDYKSCKDCGKLGVKITDCVCGQ